MWVVGCVLECLLILVCSWNPSMTCDVCARADINADANTVMRTALLPHTCRYLFDVCAHSRTPPMSARTGGRRASTFKLKHETDVCYLIHIRPRRRLRKRTLAGEAVPSRSYRAAHSAGTRLVRRTSELAQTRKLSVLGLHARRAGPRHTCACAICRRGGMGGLERCFGRANV